MARSVKEQATNEELLAIIKTALEQAPNNPKRASIAVVVSGVDGNNETVSCHLLANPHTIANVLLNEAIMFDRADKVLAFIGHLRHVLTVAELNIHHQLRDKSAKN